MAWAFWEVILGAAAAAVAGAAEVIVTANGMKLAARYVYGSISGLSTVAEDVVGTTRCRADRFIGICTC